MRMRKGRSSKRRTSLQKVHQQARWKLLARRRSSADKIDENGQVVNADRPPLETFVTAVSDLSTSSGKA